ncbi:helix-turn-helix transcriptional regulator [Sphingomonas sp. R1]|uniref:S24 family peptidase n=1 Tax=Sphingomonas sp. R1 TaxID=399176 RepID=UPI0022240178|nr:LexA family transcriptional regulator [Sphingomonas sp. R1]UYY77771.1 hypothetical protein OIM94_01830 [Sphingomonas sp. R1]
MERTGMSIFAIRQEHFCKQRSISDFAIRCDMSGLEHDQALIRELCQWVKLTPTALAREAGVAATTVTRPYAGTANSRISTTTLGKLKARFPEFPGWTRPEPDFIPPTDDPDYVTVKVLPTYAGMGGGGTGDGEEATALVPRHLVERELRGRPSDFEMVNVRGDSMEPIFHHGDQLLIDKRDRNPIQPGPFAIFDGDAYLVKLVERCPGKRGYYRVFSANPRYSEVELSEEEASIMGRPVWFARRL